MKNLKVTTVILAMAFIGLTVVSCKDVKKENNNEEGHHMETSHDNSDGHHDEETTHDNSEGHHEGDNDSSMTNTRGIDANAQNNATTSPIIDAYIQIKNGLVADSKKQAAKGGTALLAAFSKFDMTQLTGETHNQYMEILESAKEHAEHIIKSPIDHQREHFEVLSTDINDLIALVGTDKVLYQDFCPMFNDGKGAIWLSEIKDIKNPYYGSKMLTCGKIQKQIN